MRMERLEEQVRMLTGEVERLGHELRQAQDQLRRQQEDTDFRLRELEGSGDGVARAPQPSAPPAAGTVPPQERPLGAPPSTLGTLSVDPNTGAPVGAAPPQTDPGAPIDLSALTRPGALDATGAPAVAPPSGDPRDAYDLAYGYILRGDYALAEVSFSDFLASFPDSDLRPNATFWLGEAHFAQGDFTEAAEAFLVVYTDYPQDPKVPDALLKLAMSLHELGVTDQACATYQKVISDYPNAARAVRDMAAARSRDAGC